MSGALPLQNAKLSIEAQCCVGNDFFNSSRRRAIRLSIRKSLQEVESPATKAKSGSKKGDSCILKEAKAVFEIDASGILYYSMMMNFAIISWNVRGLGKWEKIRAVRKVIHEQKPGSAGGLISMWDSDFFVVSNQVITERYIAIFGNFKESNFECGFLNVYGPSVDADKGPFFSEVSEFLSNFNLPWCVCGDFNLFLHEGEKVGGPINWSLLEVFRNFVQVSGLVDLTLKGGSFTWSNLRDPPTLVRLDRFLVSPNFLENFHFLEQRLLSKSISDHNAIALVNVAGHWGSRPFKIFNYHFDEPGFDEMVTKYLGSTVGGRRKGGVLKVLKGAKGAIKEWVGARGRASRGCVGSLEEQIHNLELIQAQGHGDSNSARQIAILRGRLWKELRIEERAWLQKSRLKWNIEEVPLRVSFPRIFVVCSFKQGCIADFGTKEDGVWSWDVPLRRQLFDWELEQWNTFMNILNGFRGNNFNSDWVRWVGTRDGVYSVKSLVNKLSDCSSSGGDWKDLVWRGIAPPKVKVFTWLVIRQRIPVRVELAARGLSLRDNIMCPLCGLVPESVAHLLFNFRFRVASWYKAKFSDFSGSVDALIVDPSLADRADLSKGRVVKARLWEAPPDGYLKLNVDGAMAGDGSKGGIGGIIRNSRGVCLAKFSLPIGPGPPILAELEAILRGLKFFFTTRGLNRFRLVLESDCAVAIGWISLSSPCPSVFEPLVRSCSEIIISKSVVFRLVPRVVNLEADLLAKEAC
ncbi:hypothetical protein GQ457_15G008560 [Hibiscus cannabinus]